MSLYEHNSFNSFSEVRKWDVFDPKILNYSPNAANGKGFRDSLSAREDQTKQDLKTAQEFLNIFWASAKFEWRKIKITDVTLREWDQAPLTSFSKDEKMFIYLMLRELQIDTIEVWFPAGDNDFKNVKELVAFFKDDPSPPYISVLGRSLDHDTWRSIEATKWLKKARIHSFIATSDAHILEKFCLKEELWVDWETQLVAKRTLEEWQVFVIESIKTSVSRLKKVQTLRRNNYNQDLEIEWSPEDASNTKYDFLLRCVRTAIESWANIINVPDTVWIVKPEEYKSLFYHLVQDTEDLREKWYKFRFSSHIHNDKDFASAATLGAAEGWVSDVETTQLWVWERAWNTKTHIAQMMFWVDGEANWWFELNSAMNHEFTAIFSKAIKKILGDDLSNREAWIGKNVESDWAWVHQQVRLYWWAKEYAWFFWVLWWEGYFSARWWKNGLKILANTLWIETSKLKWADLTWFISELSKEAEITRRVYPANILQKKLQREKRISDLSYKNEGDIIAVKFTIDQKEIIIRGKADEKNGYIWAIVSGIKEQLWDAHHIEHLEYSSREKHSQREIMNTVRNEVDQLVRIREEERKPFAWLSEYFNEKLEKLIAMQTSGNEWENSIWVSHFRFKVNWIERNAVTHWNDVKKAEIEAIIYALLPEIMQANQISINNSN